MPPRSVSPGPGGKKAIARKRQMPSGALSGLRVIGALLTLLIMSVLLDETATCIDYVWEAMSVKFVLLAYVLAMFLAAEHARKNGYEKTWEYVLSVLDWMQEEGPRILLLFFLLVQPLASKIRDLDDIAVDQVCPLKEKGIFSKLVENGLENILG